MGVVFYLPNRPQARRVGGKPISMTWNSAGHFFEWLGYSERLDTPEGMPIGELPVEKLLSLLREKKLALEEPDFITRALEIAIERKLGAPAGYLAGRVEEFLTLAERAERAGIPAILFG